MKAFKCCVCKTDYFKSKTTQKVCSTKCAIELAKEKNNKIIKKIKAKEKKEGLEKLKTKSDYLKDVQKVFNQYIRLRDKNKRCISCNCIIKGVGHASHYFSVGGHPNLRFNEDNVHLSCIECNVYLHGNIVEYSIRLPERIGVEKYDKLRDLRNLKKHYSIPELIALKEYYKNKIKSCK